MSASKAALRAAKAAIDEQRYDDAAAHVEKVLVSEPRNYHA
jgi:predicted negative regulator of RcsB-dependent stress response